MFQVENVLVNHFITQISNSFLYYNWGEEALQILKYLPIYVLYAKKSFNFPNIDIFQCRKERNLINGGFNGVDIKFLQ